MSARVVPIYSNDKRECDRNDGMNLEIEAMKVSILRFGSAEKATKFGITVFTGEVPEKVRYDLTNKVTLSGAFIFTNEELCCAYKAGIICIKAGCRITLSLLMSSIQEDTHKNAFIN